MIVNNVELSGTIRVLSDAAPTSSLGPLDSLSDVTVETPNHNEVLVYDVESEQWVNSPLPSGVTDDKDVKVSATDNTPGFLLSKVVSGTGIAVTKKTSAGGEQLEITINSPLSELVDVSVDTAVAGEYLKFDGTRWVSAVVTGGTGGATNLDGLLDVTITAPINGQTLTYNNGTWVNTNNTLVGGITTLTALNDVVITGVQDGQSLVCGSTLLLTQIQVALQH